MGVLSILIVGTLSNTSAVAQLECGTVPSEATIQTYLRRVAMGMNENLVAIPAGGTEYVPLTFHIVQMTDGTGGIQPFQLDQALIDANTAFTGSGIQFCWDETPLYIDDTNFYEGIDTLAELNALRSTNPVPDTINIYFTSHVETEGGVWAGMSSFPTDPVQGIVMDNLYSGLSSRPSTFPHELGHYFYLFHTHQDFILECVDGSNCLIAGDLLCDTPADPRLGSFNVDVFPSCAYIGSETPPCDSNAFYNPDTRNLMSYSRSLCRDNFTTQQIQRMQNSLIVDRPELQNPSCSCSDYLEIKLTASDGSTSDFFGRKVSISGTPGNEVAIVGSSGDDDIAMNSGAAYIYRFNGVTWDEEQKLVASDGAEGEAFGLEVSISGSPGNEVAIIGAALNDNGPQLGAAYIYRFNGVTWDEEQKLVASDGKPYDRFGFHLSISGPTGNEVAILGAARIDGLGPNTNSGAAYIYRFNGVTWDEEQKLIASDIEAFDTFGVSVSISSIPGNEVAIVGSSGDDDNDLSSGSAYIYRFNGVTWDEEQKLVASDGAFFDLFGTSVSISIVTGNEVAIVGAFQDDDHVLDSGSAYIYRFNGVNWDEEQKLLAFDDVSDLDAEFGQSVSISGTPGFEVAIVGARFDNDNGISSGSAYTYRFNGVNWVEEQKVVGSDIAAGDQSGFSVSISSEVAIVGAHMDDENGSGSGSAYIYQLNCNAEIPAICPADTDGSGDVNVTDLLALLAAWGPNPGHIADFNDDGNVNVTDLLALLAAWGPCP